MVSIIFDFYRSLVFVWKYFTLYFRNICNDKNLARKRVDGGSDSSDIVVELGLFGGSKDTVWKLAVVYDGYFICSFCD